MADAFTDALDELKDALTNGEDVDAAIAVVAADHGMKSAALRNRAMKAWGDLTEFGARNREKVLEAIARQKESEAIAIAREVIKRPMRELDNRTEEERKAVKIALHTDRFWRRV